MSPGESETCLCASIAMRTQRRGGLRLAARVMMSPPDRAAGPPRRCEQLPRPDAQQVPSSRARRDVSRSRGRRSPSVRSQRRVGRRLLHAMEVRGEGRQEDATRVALAEDRVERGADRALRGARPVVLDVGRVGEQQQHALGAPCRPGDSDRPSAVERRWSILKSPVCTTTPAGVRIARPTESGIECVICERLDGEGAERDSGSPARMPSASARQAVLAQAFAHEAERAAACPSTGTLQLARARRAARRCGPRGRGSGRRRGSDRRARGDR